MIKWVEKIEQLPFDLGENATRSLTEQGGDRRQDVTTALLLKELDCTSLNKWIRDGNRE